MLLEDDRTRLRHMIEAAKEANGDIPWQDIVRMRNRLVHAYFDIDLDVVWETAREELPGLIDRLETLLEKG